MSDPLSHGVKGRVKLLINLSNHITTLKHQLEEQQKACSLPRHKLKTDVSTRWKSACEMVDRFAEQQPAVCAVALSPQVKKRKPNICTLREADVSNAEDLIPEANERCN